MTIFSERLKELRQQKNISMLELSKHIGVSDAAICKWENEDTEPKASNIYAVANFFEVTADFLLGLENEWGTKTYYTPKIAISQKKEKEIELMDIFSELAPMYRTQILEYARYIAIRVNNTKKYKGGN